MSSVAQVHRGSHKSILAETKAPWMPADRETTSGKRRTQAPKATEPSLFRSPATGRLGTNQT
jgi:hypothetical protein